jgi:hypothetical protein
VSQVLVDPNSAAFAEASARLREYKAKYRYGGFPTLQEPSNNWYKVAKVSNPFEDENVSFFTGGVKSVGLVKAICSCEDNFYRNRICIHIVEVWEVTGGQPAAQLSLGSFDQTSTFACSRSASKPATVRRCGCGAPAYLDGTRCKACQVEHDAEIAFYSHSQLEKDTADIFG